MVDVDTKINTSDAPIRGQEMVAATNERSVLLSNDQ